MSIKTRKHIWPVSLVMSIAIVGALAAFLVLGANPGPTQAQDDKCTTATGECTGAAARVWIMPGRHFGYGPGRQVCHGHRRWTGGAARAWIMSGW